jgi:hypothetical protein
MIVASHRRSGTHFLMQALRLTFGRKLLLHKTHSLASEVRTPAARIEYIGGEHIAVTGPPQQEPILYIVRDVRDCLTSSYHWWRTSMESECGGILPHFRDVTPTAYIRGAVRLEAVPTPHPGCGVNQAHIDLGIFADPAGFWARHVEGYLGQGVPVIRYEDLLRQPRKTLRDAAGRLGLARPWFPRAPRRLVGHDPRKGVIGDHRTLFDAATLRLIDERAGAVMAALGYGPF